MQRMPSRGYSSTPPTSQGSTSFQRYESSPHSPTDERSAPNTLQAQSSDLSVKISSPAVMRDQTEVGSDIFEGGDDRDGDKDVGEDPTGAFTNGYEELPVEIQSLMERFLESLALKSQPNSLSMDRLSELYQDFYEHAQSHIDTHIAALSARISRDVSPAPSTSSNMSGTSRGGKKNISTPARTTSSDPLVTDQQMLTASEITDKRKARRQLEIKRVGMEEAVERGVCEKVYARLWRHQSTDDEERDEKLRSRAAALSVVGVDLKELLSTALEDDTGISTGLQRAGEADESIRNRLANARANLETMNSERYPLGKINCLTAVHKDIVEFLQEMFPSSSSADEILPTLIFTVISCAPEINSVISNFNFIQRFRKSGKLDGEAAYCLTNLEAAITFLETVDLSSIRPNDSTSNVEKPSSRPSTPREGASDPLYRGLPEKTPYSPIKSPKRSKEAPSPTRSTRTRSSSSLKKGANPLEMASDAVLHGADTAFDNIHSALDGGFRFLFGRMKEKQSSPLLNGSSTPVAPKTLEDARKLVTPPVNSEDDASIGEGTFSEQTGDATDDRLSLREQITDAAPSTSFKTQPARISRERSADSNPSGTSNFNKRAVSFHGPESKPASTSQQSTGFSSVETMKSLGNTFNPLKGFSSLRGFARPNSSASSTPSVANSTATSSNMPVPASSPTPLNGQTDHNAAGVDASDLPTLDLEGIAPPIERFLELKDARELNFFDVELLLRDYQRLAGALKAAKRS